MSWYQAFATALFIMMAAAVGFSILYFVIILVIVLFQIAQANQEAIGVLLPLVVIYFSIAVIVKILGYINSLED